MLQTRFIVYLIFVWLIIGCRPGEKHYNDKVFRYNESKGIATLDPVFARNQTTIWPVNQLFNGLLQLSTSLEIKPCIAKKFSISADGKIYTFQLRNDVFFHRSEVFGSKENKGRNVVAADFVYSFKRIINPRVASPGAWIFGFVDLEKADSGFEAVNDSTFRIYLKQAFPPLPGILTMQYCSVVPYEAVKAYGSGFGRKPVGTGPFSFKYWKDGEKLIFSRNPDYFEIDSDSTPLPHLEAVSITFIADKQSEFLEFIKGNLDIISGLHPTFKDELVTRNGTLRSRYAGKIKMITRPYLNTEYLGFLIDTNSERIANSPVRFKAVRLAINYGFDREKMIRYMRNNIGNAALQGFIPEGLPSFSTSLKGYNYNPDKARILLASAGFPEGNGLPAITLMTTSDYVDLCEYIQHELMDIGIKIDIEVSTGASFREMVAQAKLPFFRGSWIADYPDAENYLALFYSKNFSPSGPNYFHFRNVKFDQLYEKALKTTDEKIRFGLYRQMDSIIVAEGPVVPLYYDRIVRFVHCNITGLEPNPMNLLVLKYARKK